MSGARLAAVCAEVRDLFPAYLEETLSRVERSSVREHLAACPACRSEAASTDPAFLFALFAPEAEEVSAVSDDETAKILAGVRAGIALKAAEKRIRPASRKRERERQTWRRPAMTAAATVAAVALAWSFAPRPQQAQQASRDVPAASAAAVAAVESPLLRPASLAPATEPGVLEPAKSKGNLPADATIYDWNPGGGQPRVVWIVDRSLDI